MFSSKYKFVKKRLGERNKSTLVKKVGKLRVYNIRCKIDLRDYIKQFILDNK